jgi:DNA-directed RNA polymerase specialized sigma24 family protein
MEEKHFTIIDKKLSTLIKLLGAQLIQDKDYRNQVEFLYKAGLSYKDIASLTGKTENNVKVTLHLIKKAKK